MEGDYDNPKGIKRTSKYIIWKALDSIIDGVL